MRENMNKTKVMISGGCQKPMQKAARWPCGVCGGGVGSNSIQLRCGVHNFYLSECDSFPSNPVGFQAHVNTAYHIWSDNRS